MELSDERNCFPPPGGPTLAGRNTHRTERFGVQALGRLLRKRFGLKVSFMEIPNPYQRQYL